MLNEYSALTHFGAGLILGLGARILTKSLQKEAIMVTTDRVVVNQERCVGCGICVIFCPLDAIEGLGIVEINREICSDCMTCVEACPVDAIEVSE